jgi:hypothetical protein
MKSQPVSPDYEPNEREQQFLHGIVDLGMSPRKAYEYAGYAFSRTAPYLKARRLAPIIGKYVQQRLVGNAPVALDVMYQLMTDENVPPSVRLNASKEWLSRSGFSPTVEMRITEGERGIDEMSEEELAVRARKLLKKLQVKEYDKRSVIDVVQEPSDDEE